MIKKTYYIAVDFDGTISTVAKGSLIPLPGAFEVLKELQKRGHCLILHTLRTEGSLQQALDFCKTNGVEFVYANENPEMETGVRKIYADFYIDDRNVGTPVNFNSRGEAQVDWVNLRKLMVQRDIL